MSTNGTIADAEVKNTNTHTTAAVVVAPRKSSSPIPITHARNIDRSIPITHARNIQRPMASSAPLPVLVEQDPLAILGTSPPTEKPKYKKNW